MNPTKRRTRLAFLARVMREEANLHRDQVRGELIGQAIQLTYVQRTLDRCDQGVVDAFMDAAIDTIVQAASSRTNWQVAA